MLVLVLTVGTLLAACEAGATNIFYRNDTAERLFVEVNRQGVNALPPGKTTEVTYALFNRNERVQVKVTDEQACVVLTRSSTVGELRNKKLIITASDLPSPDMRTACPKPTPSGQNH